MLRAVRGSLSQVATEAERVRQKHLYQPLGLDPPWSSPREQAGRKPPSPALSPWCPSSQPASKVPAASGPWSFRALAS